MAAGTEGCEFLGGELWKGRFYFSKSPIHTRGSRKENTAGGSQELSPLGVWHNDSPLRHPTPQLSPFSANDVTPSP